MLVSVDDLMTLVIEALFGSLNLDASRYALEVTAATPALFSSTDEALRANAATTWTNVIQRCSDAETCKALLDALNAVVDGKSGKLTVPEQRTNAIRVYPVFVKAPLSASAKASIISHICEKLIALSKAVW